jgi:hypothetical protein
MTTFVNALLGLALLTTGRKLYWLFVGVVGFVLGITLSKLFFPTESELALVAIALVAGVLGAVLAFFLQRLAVGVAGFAAGGYLLEGALETLEIGIPEWIVFLIGGIVGVVLVVALFDWALIILSSLMGASMLANIIPSEGWLLTLIFVGLSIAGIGMQVTSMRAESR